jgi:hypothetical protein
VGNDDNIRTAGKQVSLEPKKRRRSPRGYWKSSGKIPEDFRASDPLPGGLGNQNSSPRATASKNLPGGKTSILSSVRSETSRC